MMPADLTPASSVRAPSNAEAQPATIPASVSLPDLAPPVSHHQRRASGPAEMEMADMSAPPVRRTASSLSLGLDQPSTRTDTPSSPGGGDVLAMERAGLLDPTGSGGLEDINLEEGDSSKAFRTPASKVDLESLRRTPVWNVVVNSVTYMATPMSMPATMAQSGWGWGLLLLFYSGGVTYHTGRLLGEICYANPELDTFPKVVEGALARYLSRRQPERHAKGGTRCLLKTALWVTLILQFVTYYLDTVAQIIYVEQYFGELIPQSPICQWQWLLVTWLISIPVMQIPTLHESRYISCIAMFWVCANVLCIAYEVWLVQPWSCDPGPSFPPTNPLRLLMAASSMAYAFGGHGVFPEEHREMKNPERWPEVMNWMYAVIMPMYAFSAVAGFAAYGGFSQANLNLNFPNNSMNVVSLLMQLPACLYLIYFTNLVLVLQVEIAFGVDPTEYLGGKWVFGLPPVLFRFVWRTLFLGSQVLLAESLLSGTGDVILGLQSLSGAVGMTAFTYFLPFLCHGAFEWDTISTKPLVLFYYGFNVVMGLVVMVGGIYVSVAELTAGAANAGGMFHGLCHLSYSYAPESPDDPCFISGFAGDGREEL